MPAEKMRSARFPAVTFAQANELARLWGPVVPLSFSEVVRESIRRAYEAEEKKRRKSPVGG